MDVRNCKLCNSLFNYDGNSLCPACRKKMDDKFLEVRQYIYDNPTASMTVVAEENDVPIQQIKRWIREERLSFSKDSGISIECEKCGKPILTGRYCTECRNNMTHSLNKLYASAAPVKKDKKSESAKMRFLGN